MRLAVVGATGAVGRELIKSLQERDFPVDDLILFASARSEGQRLPFRGAQLSVRSLEKNWFQGVDLALVTAGGDISRRIVPEAAAAGTVSVDTSSAFRMDPEVPLVIPEINAGALERHKGIVANPNCTGITALMALAPLHRRFGLRTLVTSSYQSVSGAGMKGIRELSEQIQKLHGQEEGLGQPEKEALPRGEVFGKTIAFNVLPFCESFDPFGSGFTTEELKMGAEARKILDAPDLFVVATSVRVPVVVGHAVSIYATFRDGVSPDAARGALAAAPGVRLIDEPTTERYPTPLEAAGIDDVLVGRVRQAPEDRHGLALFAAGDNLRKGAALNAVQIAEALVAGNG